MTNTAKHGGLIDLHTHTNHSDGRQTAEQIVQKAHSSGVTTLSITDHNNVDVYDTLPEHGGIRVIRGVELFFTDGQITNEILGYGISPAKIKPFLADDHRRNTALLMDKIVTMRERFVKLGFKMSPVAVIQGKQMSGNLMPPRTCLNDAISHPENEKILKRYNLSVATSFYDNHICNPESAFYMPEIAAVGTTLEQASSAIRAAGGRVFMAHIFKIRWKSFAECGAYLETLVARKLVDGIEVFHPYHDTEKSNFLAAFCKTHNLLVSGGTDNHAPEKPLGVAGFAAPAWVEEIE
jgi:predicted metal-dependent phosphoesterase TrpH